jgi:hypothetical protein
MSATGGAPARLRNPRLGLDDKNPQKRHTDRMNKLNRIKRG